MKRIGLIPVLNVSGISGMLPDQRRSVRRTSREAVRRVAGGEATPRTTREATGRRTAEATRRTHGQR